MTTEPDASPTPDPLGLDTEFRGRLYYKAIAGNTGGRPRTLGFTDAEKRVLKWLMRGYNDSKTGAELGISAPTVKRHIRNMRAVSNTKTRIELVAWAIHNGFSSE